MKVHWINKQDKKFELPELDVESSPDGDTYIRSYNLPDGTIINVTHSRTSLLMDTFDESHDWIRQSTTLKCTLAELSQIAMWLHEKLLDEVEH